jgi:hypothetical protein
MKLKIEIQKKKEKRFKKKIVFFCSTKPITTKLVIEIKYAIYQYLSRSFFSSLSLFFVFSMVFSS